MFSTLVAIAAMFWAITDVRFRDVEGAITGSFVLPWAVGIAAVLVGYTARTAWFRSAAWAALCIISYAASLTLIDAGPRIHYQHYRPERLTLPVAIILAIQLIAVLRNSGAVVRWLRSLRLPKYVALLFAFTLLFSAALSEQILFYVGELSFAALFLIVQLANVILAVNAMPTSMPSRLRTFLSKRFGDEPVSGIDPVALTGAIWIVVAGAVLNVFSYQSHPHIPDEVVYVYQARYLAAGMLQMPLPPIPAAFDLDLMNYEASTWFCPVPPGWPFLLSIGMAAGIPWLVNPLLGGLNILLSYILFRDLYSRRVARIGVLLLCVSPWYIFMAMNFMTHSFTLLCVLTGAIGIVRWRRTDQPGWAALAGAAAGVGSLIRPLDGMVVFLWFVVLAIAIERKRMQFTGAAAFLIFTGIVGALTLPYNQLLTGSPFKSPIMAYADKYYGPDSNSLGFGPNRGLGWALDPFPGHSPLDAAINGALNGFSLQNELFGWGMGSLTLVTLFLLFSDRRRTDWLLMSLVGLTIGAYCFYYYSGGPDFGARYWYVMLPACIVLTARAVEFLQNRLGSGGDTRLLLAVGALGLAAVTVYVPWRAVDKYWHYLYMRRGIQQIATDCGGSNSLVLVRGARFPDYSSAAVYNPIDLNAAEPIYAWDKEPKVRQEVLRAYSGRSVCIVEGPTVTKQGFRVVEGPVPASALLSRSGPAR